MRGYYFRGALLRRSISSSISAQTSPSSRHVSCASAPSHSSSKTSIDVPETTVVADAESALAALDVLSSLDHSSRFYAVDTEVADIDLANHGPVGNGTVTCFSLYAGDDVDFGSGPRLWVDTLVDDGALLRLFQQPLLENESMKKVWHNYSFDRHVLYNHGVNAVGLAGDTMHMARLFDTALPSYSLENLTKEFVPEYAKQESMKAIFGIPRRKKDGTAGKIVDLPDARVIQQNPEFLERWIDYSCQDTVSTWKLYMFLRRKLHRAAWYPLKVRKASSRALDAEGSMLDLYEQNIVPFGELLTDIERTGMRVDAKSHLRDVQRMAEKDVERSVEAFMEWVRTDAVGCFPGGERDAARFNPASAVQKRQLFFGKRDSLETFTIENTEGILEGDRKTPLKKREMQMGGLGIPFKEKTPKGFASVTFGVMKELAGEPDDDVFGSAMKAFKCKEEGQRACRAIASLNKSTAISTLLSTFIVPLQNLTDENGRIHASLNLNTETGRLSSRMPNLQNQPALEKDIYRIREAFTCDEGNTLIVADYGQLELRLLAHLTQCKSMITAFNIGGDFHSRTAAGMYPYIAEALAAGDCLVDDDGSIGKPLVKDVYPNERRRAKVLNFSIAYGKTSHGLAKDWGVSRKEAQEIVDLWYSDRPEVLRWQEKSKRIAMKTGVVRTMWGRTRNVAPLLKSKAYGMQGRVGRVAINTPIQGSAADVVMQAMIYVQQCEEIKSLGYRMVLQVHDEIIMEGPEVHADRAKVLLDEAMKRPFRSQFERTGVKLEVDVGVARTWYEAK